MILTSDLCSRCPSRNYKPGTSITRRFTDIYWQLELPSYQGLHLQTIETFDRVCLAQAVCFDDTDLYVVMKQEHSSVMIGGEIDGVFGVPTRESTETNLV